MASSPVKVFPTVTNRCMQSSGSQTFLYCSTLWRLGIRTSRQIQIGLVSTHLGASTLWCTGRCYFRFSVCPFRFSPGQVHRRPGSGGQVTRPESYIEPERCTVTIEAVIALTFHAALGHPGLSSFFLVESFFFDKFIIYVLLLAQNIKVTSLRLSENAASCRNTRQPWALPKACSTFRPALLEGRGPLQ